MKVIEFCGYNITKCEEVQVVSILLQSTMLFIFIESLIRFLVTLGEHVAAQPMVLECFTARDEKQISCYQ